ncbi:MAG: XrtA system polysaccharide chain length determinant [Methylococcales bacterium]
MIDSIFPYLRALLRDKWLALWIAWAVCVLGWSVVLLWPDKYESKAKIHVDTQSILAPLLEGMAIQPNIDVRVELMTKILLGRPNIERVIRMVDLDIDIETEDDFEKLVKKLQNSIDINAAGAMNLYTIAARYSAPEEAKSIVQSLLSIFVEEIQGKVREESDQASRFLDTQVQAYEQRLSDAEKNLEAFKRKYVGELPDEGATFYQDYQKTKTLLEKSHLQLQEALNKREALKRQMEGDEPTYLGLGDKKSQFVEGNFSSRIKELQQTRDNLLITYTNEHPSVKAVTRMLEDLQSQQSQKSASGKPINTPLLLGDKLTSLQKSTFFQQLTVALGKAEAEAAAMQARVAEYTNRLAILKKRMNSALGVETKLQGLNRDYLIIKKRYDDLLSRRETARLSERVEKTKVVKFRIVESPSLPRKPVAPNRPFFATFVLLSGVLMGLGVSIIRSMIYPAFYTVKQLASVIGKPVLGSIENIVLPEENEKNALTRLKFIAACFALLASFGVVVLISILTTTDTTHDVSVLDSNAFGTKQS